MWPPQHNSLPEANGNVGNFLRQNEYNGRISDEERGWIIDNVSWEFEAQGLTLPFLDRDRHS
jgi:hypothetical protein